MTTTIQYCVKTLSNIYICFANSPFLIKVAKLAVAAWMFFAGIHVYFYCILVLTTIDVVTGVAASIKKGEPFKSKILRKGLIEKGILYNVLMLSVFALEMIIKTAVEYKAFYLVLISSMMIGTYELSSIVENLILINPNLSFLKSILKMSNKIHDKTIEVAEKKIDEVTDIPKGKE